MRVAVVATCSLNQWALDFTGNVARVRESIRRARAAGATVRLGPELEITGYGCEDHFLEPDTFNHAWEGVAHILRSGDTNGILVDVGMPVIHRSVPYNCRVMLLNGRIVLIRPKMYLADDGNYRESRWFRPWPRGRSAEQFVLPQVVRDASTCNQHVVSIGPAILDDHLGVSYASESCEELWTPDPPHALYGLAGVHIIANASASHHALRKLKDRLDLISRATRNAGGAYLYANQIGCDGGRLYYDGSSLVAVNGFVVAHGQQFMIHDEVQVVTAAVDLDDIHSYRLSCASRGVQASSVPDSPILQRIVLPNTFAFEMPKNVQLSRGISPALPMDRVELCLPQEEIAKGPACWLWDYLRRCGMNGFLLPLSGGADSSATAAIVGSMCEMLVDAINTEITENGLRETAVRTVNMEENNFVDTHDDSPPTNSSFFDSTYSVLREVRRVTNTVDEEYTPTDSRDLAHRIFHTVYMGSAKASSESTKLRAQALANDIGAWHCSLDIGSIVDATLNVFASVVGSHHSPRFRVDGGSNAENLALQNIQARIRMLLAYLFAQLAPWSRGKSGSLLVLGSANVDEGLRGYLTKYDCSSADINPIGGISKADLKLFLQWAAQPRPQGLGFSSLGAVVEAAPTAELEPITAEYTQSDEADMGMTYEELTWYGRLRKLQRCGPVSMFNKLASIWKYSRGFSPAEVAQKVKYFFRMYAVNRHKMTTLTPSYHAENYSPEDNRFDLRPFLYNARWTWQFSKMDEEVKLHESAAIK